MSLLLSRTHQHAAAEGAQAAAANHHSVGVGLGSVIRDGAAHILGCRWQEEGSAEEGVRGAQRMACSHAWRAPSGSRQGTACATHSQPAHRPLNSRRDKRRDSQVAVLAGRGTSLTCAGLTPLEASRSSRSLVRNAWARGWQVGRCQHAGRQAQAGLSGLKQAITQLGQEAWKHARELKVWRGGGRNTARKRGPARQQPRGPPHLAAGQGGSVGLRLESERGECRLVSRVAYVS